MVPPGTPAVVLPAFQPTLFTGTSKGPLPSLNLIGTGTNLPFSIGHSFPEGTLTPGESLQGVINGIAVPLQVDHRATWPDGSTFHAVISGVAPGTGVTMRLERGGRFQAPAVEPSVDHGVIIVHNGVTYRAMPASLKAPHLLGPFITDYSYPEDLVTSEGVKHPFLRAWFNVRDYQNNTEVDVVMEHCKAYATQGFYTPPATAALPNPAPIPVQMDLTYDIKIFVGGEVRHDQVGMVHFALTRPHWTFWRNGRPDLFVQHDTKYIQDSLATPKYADITIDKSWLTEMAAAIKGINFAQFGRGGFTAAMGTTGGRPEIGMMPAQYAAYMVSGAREAWDYMIAQANRSGSWPMHRTDDSTGPAAGRPLDVIHWPSATILGNVGDAQNRLTGRNERLPREASNCTLQPEESHQPAMVYLPALLTGKQVYLDELHHWAGFNQVLPNCHYRDYHKGNLANGQVRGQAWNLRTMAECAAITPDDHPYKAAAHYFLENSLDSWIKTHVTPPPVPQVVPPIGKHHTAFGAHGDGAIYAQADWDLAGVKIDPDGSAGIGPWQDNFFMAAALHAWELTKKPQLLKILMWKAKFVVDMVNSPLHDGMDSCPYSLRVRETSTSPFYPDVDTCLLNTFDPIRYTSPPGSAERLAYVNKIRGLPSAEILLRQFIGYVENMQPALAAATTLDYPGARAAWSKFAASPGKPVQTRAPQWAMVPRPPAEDAVVVEPPVVVPPPVVVVPPPVVVEPPPVVVEPPPVVTPPPVPEPRALLLEFDGVSIIGSRFAKGQTYAVTITTATGELVAMAFPVVAK